MYNLVIALNCVKIGTNKRCNDDTKRGRHKTIDLLLSGKKFLLLTIKKFCWLDIRIYFSAVKRTSSGCSKLYRYVIEIRNACVGIS